MTVINSKGWMVVWDRLMEEWIVTDPKGHQKRTTNLRVIDADHFVMEDQHIHCKYSLPMLSEYFKYLITTVGGYRNVERSGFAGRLVRDPRTGNSRWRDG